MPDFKKIMKNYEPTEVTGNFIVLYKDEETWLEGWIQMEPTLEEFISLIKEEIEDCWDPEKAKISDYIIFHIDLEDKNNLKEIKDNEYYQWVRGHEEIFIVVLHKDIKYRIIENIPTVFEWFMEIL
ncbi:MAG: hypothetical protein ACFFDH_20315 [Promethearchaeota archaeon]